MTERLYYEDSYLTHFSATVTKAVKTSDGKSIVYLNQSAFYPTSGGQPYDTGTIGDARVVDVYVDENEDVAHVVEGEVREGSKVQCLIDWTRRFDHMQQHAGEHMLAGCVYRQLNGHTIGLHLGHDDSSIDVELPDGRTNITLEEMRALEDEVNFHIQNDEPISCYFPGDDEISSIPLRKAPAVSKHVRVVQIGDWEYCACGGTHPSSTGEIALVKIIDARPSRGKMRLTFLCGKRAFEHYRKCFDTIKQLSAILSADANALPGAASELVSRLKETQYELNRVKTDRALDEIKMLMENEHSETKITVVRHLFSSLHAEGLKKAAEMIIARPRSVALLGSSEGENINLLFARSEDVQCDMGKLLSEVVKQCGGKGGGKSDFARGASRDTAVLEKAQALLFS